MSILFTSDLHFGHTNIITACERNLLNCGQDFTTVEEMNEFLINKWNQKVNDDDEVYVLGDVSFRSKVAVKTYLQRLKGHKHLIIGNHDFQWMKNCPDIGEYFESVSHFDIIKVDHKMVTLCHFPLLEWNGSSRANNQDTSNSWLIHGHIHNTKDKTYEYIRDNLPCALNCGVDTNDFEPVTFEELLENNNRWYERY